MKKIYSTITRLMALAVILSSCDSFLEENPKTFLNPDSYYQNEKQVLAAVNGIYTFVDDIMDSDIEPGSQSFIFLEFMHGYGERMRGQGTQDLVQANSLLIADNNSYVQRFWETAYKAIENCNSVIEGIEGMEEGSIAENKKNQYLGETYFLRGYFYFNLVRLYGPVPLKLTPTKDVANTAIELSSVEDVYNQIDEDMAKAGELMENPDWTNVSGRVTKGTVKSMHAKVLLTMAGYPLQKGAEYYTRAYTMAKQVYNSKAFELFDTYEELRTVENSGEIIWSVQREADQAGNPLHSALLAYPAPAKSVSASAAYGGAITVTQLFFNTYPQGDKRIQEREFYYTE
ncbi:MAG: RagB/SusD family nutrient uptake outer membrane protein [Bacteroides sp.]|nr:RagB/SusD family nutrient uptake outer membrane protein [Bacteroides sp.]